MSGILLGYELGTGSPVTIPFHHLVATGVTGLSGKTTTLEALISRAGMRAIAFRTKRGETGFEDARVHAPYYRERSDWQYVSMLLEATMREKMRFERSWIIKVSKGTHGLREVLDNVKLAKKTAKGLNESVYTNLEAYLEIVVPQIESAGIVHDLSVGEGVTVMDLEGMTDEMQSLVIASTLERVHESERDLVVVIPEAWKYCPEGRGNPVKRVAEKLIRQGATLRLYLWFDSQDLAGVDKSLLKQVDNWILGRQREINEVEHTLAQVPVPKKQKPKADEIMQLRVGQFFACYGERVQKVYVRPAWLPEREAIAVAQGRMSTEATKRYKDEIDRAREADDMVYKEQLDEANEKIRKMNVNLADAGSQMRELARAKNDDIDRLRKEVEQLKEADANLRRGWDATGKELHKTQDDLRAAKAVVREAPEIAERAIESMGLEPLNMDKLARDVATLLGSKEYHLNVEVGVPQLNLRERVVEVNASTEDNTGRFALLVAEGFLDSARTIPDLQKEFRQRGWGSWSGGAGKMNMLNLAIKFATWGFTRVDGETVVLVPGSKKRIVKESR